MAPSSRPQSFGPETDEKLRIEREKKAREKAEMMKRLESLPNRQIPGELPAYSWGGYERKDWRYIPGKIPAESLTRSPLKLIGEREGPGPLVPLDHAAGAPAPQQTHTDPNAAKKEGLHREVAQLRQEIAKLRTEIQTALQASRGRQTVHHAAPLQRGTTVPALPRARFTPMGTAVEAADFLPPSAATHFATAKNFTLDSVSQHIMGLRQQLSQKQTRLAQLRGQLRQLSGMSKVKSVPMPNMRPSTFTANHPRPLSGAVTALHRVRSQPRTLAGPKPPVHQAAGSLAHHESLVLHHLRLVNGERRWRTLLK